MIISTAIITGGKPEIAHQLLGDQDINVDSIDSYDDYCLIYHKRHDLIHASICDKLQIPFGEKRVDMILQDLKINTDSMLYFDEVRNQTPDYFTIKDNIAQIVEVTVSHDPRAKTRKAAKYALLCSILRKSGFEINYKIFVFNPTNIYSNRSDLIQDGLDDLVIDFAYKVCQNTFKLLRAVHATRDGRDWYNTYYELTEAPSNLNFSPDWTKETYKEMGSNCFHEEEDFHKIMYSNTSPKILESDEQFLKHCFEKIKTVESELISSEVFDETKFREEIDSKANTTELRSFLPLPFIDPEIDDSAVRNTISDWDVLMQLSGKMIDSYSPIISTIGFYCQKNLHEIRNKMDRKNEDFLFVVNMSTQDKKDMAVEGPNRKKYVKSGSEAHKKATDEHSGYCLKAMPSVPDVEELSFLFSQKNNVIESKNIYENNFTLSQLNGIGLKYVKLCQTVYREININSMRGDRRHKYIVKPTGAKGVFICLYKGTKLRCGELPNIVWFKIIIENEAYSHDLPFHSSWMFKKLTRDKHISYSSWLSCDVHRLDHYIRCYDKILMAYYATISQRYKSTCDLRKFKDKGEVETEVEGKSLVKYVNEDTSNLLGLISLIYLEDKRSTSKMMQNVRYLVMTSLSIYPKYKSIFDKFMEPIRTPLQLHLLNRCLEYARKMRTWKVATNVMFGSVRYDNKSHTFLDMLGGSSVRFPRPITSGSDYADFSEILSEMYFTMLFNKNQDDPTHASFQILDKILEGEEVYNKVKLFGDHLGYRGDMSDEEFVDKILDRKFTHMFSRRAIEIGSKLLRLQLDDDNADQIRQAVSNKNLDKTLDEYATFKSSSILKNKKFDPTLSRQNPRRRCIEGVLDIFNDSEGEVVTSYQVARKYREEETSYHVFKKNQIGGVREILILPITTRIRINILETLSRNICRFDPREILTHGVIKNESIKSVLYSAKKLDGTRMPIHLTFDKSRWGPSFVPIQFLYLFTSFKRELGDVYYFIIDLLIRHQNKICVLPDRLTAVWHKDIEEKHTHKYKGLQRLKNEFHNSGAITMINESNMGQGILHYTSSLLHLCMIAFRDKLYEMWCQSNGLDSTDHKDLLSSDDSYTIFCPELTKNKTIDLVRLKLSYFLRCQQLSEYLFNCRTSKVKSSVNPLIGEFNSLFISNMTFIPTLLKFAISAVHPPNTDSFYRMVKESYGSTRQIVENGGGLDLYLIASYMNKKYCESIYHTYKGGHNDFSQWGIEHKPYHIGEYPIFDPALMVIFGPDYHNYKLYKTSWANMNDKEKSLFIASHKIIRGSIIETMAEFEDGDTILGGLIRIEAAIGPVKMLDKLRRVAPLKREDMSRLLVEDPMIILKKPKTYNEILFRTCHKLYTTGSKEALKYLAASIFYGRVSASVSSNCFYIPSTEIEKTTYAHCVEQLLSTESTLFDLDKQIKFIYPKFVDYDVFINLPQNTFIYQPRNPFEIQTVQNLVTHKIYTKLTQSVPDILDYKWQNKPIPEHLITKVERDFDLIKIHFPLIKDTIEETKQQFDCSDEDRSKTVLLLMLKLYSLRDRTFKGVIFGQGSSDVTRTYEVFIQNNYTSSMNTELSQSIEYPRSDLTFEKIYCAHNHLILSEFTESKLSSLMWDEIEEKELTIFFQDPNVNKQIKKRVYMCAVSQKTIVNAEEWSGRAGFILHYWLTKQRRNDNGEYVGDYDLIVFMGHYKMRFMYTARTDRLICHKNSFDHPELLYEMFTEFAGILNQPTSEMISKMNVGKWQLIDNKILRVLTGGFDIADIEIFESVKIERCKIEIDDNWTRLVDMDTNYKLYNIETGLLATEYRPNKKYDFNVYGLSFITLCNMGAFNQNFNVSRRSRLETIDYMDDLLVTKPKITDITKRRLRLMDWDTRKEENITEDITLEDDTNIMDQLMDVEFDKDDLKLIVNDDIYLAGFQDLINFITTTDIIYSMKTVQRVQHTRRVFNIIKNLKYDLICRHVLLDMKVNKKILNHIPNMFSRQNQTMIYYSMVSLYDRIIQSDNAPSPQGYYMDIDYKFISKFKDESEE